MIKKFKKLTQRQQWVIGLIVSILLVLIPLVYIAIPKPNIDVKIYNWSVSPTHSNDNITYTELKTFFPSYITNTGNVPVHIVYCAVYMTKNNAPVNLKKYTPVEIKYLRQDESFPFNFTRTFPVSIKVGNATFGDFSNFKLAVGYYHDNLNDIRYAWIDPPTFGIK